MEFGLALIMISLMFLYVLLLGKIYIEIIYKRNKDDDYIIVNVYTLRKYLYYTMQVPMIKMMNDSVDLQATVQTMKHEPKVESDKEKSFLKNREKLVKAKPRKIRYLLKKFHYYVKIYCKFIEWLLKSLVCEKFYCKTHFGSDDAAITGHVTGLLWALKVMLTSRLRRKIGTMNQLNMEVVPVFGCNRFEVDFQCIFSIKLGNVIKAITSIYNIKQ